MAIDPLLACLDQLDQAGDDLVALLRALKALKTALVGNRARKVACCGDVPRLRKLVRLLQLGHEDGTALSVKNQAVTILGILAIPAEEALLNLLNVDTPSALWTLFRSLATFPSNAHAAPREARDLLVATLRALKSVYAAVVTISGPRVWGAITLVSNGKTETEGPRAGKTRQRVDRLPATARAALAEAFKHDNATCLLTVLTTSAAALKMAQAGQAGPSGSTWTPAAAAAWHLSVSELCCHVIASTVRTREQQVQLLSDETSARAAMSALVGLAACGHIRVEEAALDVISAVVHDFAEAATMLTARAVDGMAVDAPKIPLEIVLSCLESRTASLQLAAARCGAHLLRASTSADKALEKISLVRYRQVISVLLRLLSEHDGYEAQAASAIAYIVTGREPLQCLACELGAMRLLSSTLTWDNERMLSLEGETTIEVETQSELLQECCLNAVAQLTLDRDDLRRRVSEERLLPRIIAYLRSDSTPLRKAAVECVRALSRSANMMRSGLVEAGAADPLFELLNDEEEDTVREVAVAAVSNLVMDFSPMKEILVKKEVIPKLVGITKTCSGPLQVKALAALKNAIYWSDTALKRLVILHLGFDYLGFLIQDPEPSIQDVALNILRNLACNTETDIAMTVSGIGESRLYTLLEEKLRSSHDMVVVQAVYVLVNIATGDEYQRRPIMLRPAITRGLLAHMTHPHAEVRVGAVWCVHNLVRGVHENVVRLRALGFETRLRDLVDDLSLDVRERVAETLNIFNAV